MPDGRKRARSASLICLGCVQFKWMSCVPPAALLPCPFGGLGPFLFGIMTGGRQGTESSSLTGTTAENSLYCSATLNAERCNSLCLVCFFSASLHFTK